MSDTRLNALLRGTPKAPASFTSAADLNILIVEDDHIVGLLLRESLKVLGYDAELVESGEAGLALFAPRTFDVLLSDINLPGIDGLAVMAAFRQANPDAYVVAMTASRDVQRDEILYRRAEDAGADAVLLKPFPMPALLAIMARARDEFAAGRAGLRAAA